MFRLVLSESDPVSLLLGHIPLKNSLITSHVIQSLKKKNTIHYLSRWRAYIIRIFDDYSICLDVMVDLSRLIRHRFMIDEVERRTSRALEILGNKVECVSNDS